MGRREQRARELMKKENCQSQSPGCEDIRLVWTLAVQLPGEGACGPGQSLSLLGSTMHTRTRSPPPADSSYWLSLLGPSGHRGPACHPATLSFSWDPVCLGRPSGASGCTSLSFLAMSSSSFSCYSQCSPHVIHSKMMWCRGLPTT